MSQAARILVIGETPASQNNLSARLRSFGYDSVSTALEDAPGHHRNDQRPDIVVLNLQPAGTDAPPAFMTIADQLRNAPETGAAPIIFLGSRNKAHLDMARQAAREVRVDDVVLGPVNDMQLCGRINSLMRLSTMHDELVRRLATSAKYGADAPQLIEHPTRLDDASVLVLGATRYYSDIEHALSRDVTLTGALTPTTALDYLLRRHFDAVIVDLKDDIEAAVVFTEDVRRNSRLFNTPIVLLAPQEKADELTPVFARGVTDVLLKPFMPEEINARIMSLVRESRFRDSLKDTYAKARHMATSDALTGLYSRGFLMEHIQSLIDAYSNRNHDFSLAFFRIHNIGQINEKYGYVVGDRIIRQVGEAFGLLVRGEDLAVRYSGAAFAVLLPDTPAQSAETVLRRISGVVNQTLFSLPELSGPVEVDMATGLAGFQPSDSAQSLINRARQFCV